MLLELNAQVNKNFKDVCTPLFENSPISAFVYMEHFNESDFLYLSTDLNWAQEYLARPTMPLANQYLISQANRQQQAVSYLGATQESGDPVFSKLWYMGYMSFLNIYKKSNNRIKLWSFVSDDPTNSFTFLKNENEIIENFILYFEEKAKAFIPEKSQTLSSTKLITPMDMNLFNEKEINTQKRQFLESIKFNKITIDHEGRSIILSIREWECLKSFSSGYNTKEIAEHFDISPRTVEKYFVNIRLKTGICSKSEMISLRRNNNFS